MYIYNYIERGVERNTAALWVPVCYVGIPCRSLAADCIVTFHHVVSPLHIFRGVLALAHGQVPQDTQVVDHSEVASIVQQLCIVGQRTAADAPLGVPWTSRFASNELFGLRMDANKLNAFVACGEP